MSILEDRLHALARISTVQHTKMMARSIRERGVFPSVRENLDAMSIDERIEVAKARIRNEAEKHRVGHWSYDGRVAQTFRAILLYSRWERRCQASRVAV